MKNNIIQALIVLRALDILTTFIVLYKLGVSTEANPFYVALGGLTSIIMASVVVSVALVVGLYYGYNVKAVRYAFCGYMVLNGLVVLNNAYCVAVILKGGV